MVSVRPPSRLVWGASSQRSRAASAAPGSEVEPNGGKAPPHAKTWEVFLLGGQTRGRLCTPCPGRTAGREAYGWGVRAGHLPACWEEWRPRKRRRRRWWSPSAELKSSLTLWQSWWEREGKSPFPVRSRLALLRAPSPAEGSDGSCPCALGSSHQFSHQPPIAFLRVRSITKMKTTTSPVQGNHPPFPSRVWRWAGLVHSATPRHGCLEPSPQPARQQLSALLFLLSVLQDHPPSSSPKWFTIWL